MQLRTCVLVCVVSLSVLFAHAQNSSSTLPGTVTGHIFCSDTGLPARFASVQLQPDTAGRSESSSKSDLMTLVFHFLGDRGGPTVLTQLDGSFRLDDVAPGVYSLVSQLSGYVSPLSQLSSQELILGSLDTSRTIESQAQRVVVQSGHIVSVDVMLERGASLSGQILYDDGSPAANVQPLLLVRQKDGRWKKTKGGVVGGLLGISTERSISTDDLGRYRFTGLPAGEYAVMAELPVSQAVTGSGSLAVQLHFNNALQVYTGNVYRPREVKGVVLAQGEQFGGMDLVFPVTSLHRIAGRVFAGSDSHPVNAGSVQLLDPKDKSVLRNAVELNADGSFSFLYVPEGEYLLRVTGAGDVDSRQLKSASNSDASLFTALPDVSNSLLHRRRRYADSDQTVSVQGEVDDLIVQLAEASAQ